MIARKNTNLSHPEQTSLKVKIIPFQPGGYYQPPKSTSDEGISQLIGVADGDDETLRQRLAEREEIRQRLLTAGFLVTDIELPEPPEGWEDVDDLPPLEFPPDSPSLAQLLDEERGEY
jgi:hypothetical protein